MILKRLFTGTYSKSLVTGYANTFLQISIGLFLTPYILKYISKEEFGIYSLIGETFNVLGLLNFGFGGALSTLVARKSYDKSNVSLLSSTTFTMQLLLGILGLIIGIVLSFFFTDVFNIDNTSIIDVQIMVILFALGFLFSMIAQTYSNILVAYRKIHQDNLIRMALLIIRSAIIVVLLNLNLKMLSLAYAVFISQLIISVLAVIRVRVSIKGLSISIFNFKRKSLNELFALSIWFFLGSLSGMLIQSVDKLVTAKVVTVAAVATLVITSRLYDILKSLIFQVTNNYRPYFGKLLGEGNNTEAALKFNTLNVLSTSLAICGGLSIVMVNQTFIKLWVGPNFYGGYILDLCLYFNLIYHCWKLPYRAFLSSNLVVKPQSISGIIEGSLNILFSVLLGLKFGLVGVIAGTFISGILIQSWYLPYLMKTKTPVKITDIIKSNLSVLLEILLTLPILYIWLKYYQGKFPVFIEIAIILTLALLIFSFWFLIRRNLYKGYLKSFSGIKK